MIRIKIPWYLIVPYQDEREPGLLMVENLQIPVWILREMRDHLWVQLRGDVQLPVVLRRYTDSTGRLMCAHRSAVVWDESWVRKFGHPLD